MVAFLQVVPSEENRNSHGEPVNHKELGHSVQCRARFCSQSCEKGRVKERLGNALRARLKESITPFDGVNQAKAAESHQSERL